MYMVSLDIPTTKSPEVFSSEEQPLKSYLKAPIGKANIFQPFFIGKLAVKKLREGKPSTLPRGSGILKVCLGIQDIPQAFTKNTPALFRPHSRKRSLLTHLLVVETQPKTV